MGDEQIRFDALVAQPHYLLPLLDELPVFHENFCDFAGGANRGAGSLERLADALRPDGRGHGNDCKQHDDARGRRKGVGPGARALAMQLAFGGEVLEGLEDRHDEEGQDRARGHDDAQNLQSLGQLVEHHQQDGEADEHAVQAAGDPVNHQPESLAERGGQGYLALDAKEVSLDETQAVFAAFLLKIGNFQPVRQDVVAVVAQQRVGIEKQRADAGDEHRVVGELVDRTRIVERCEPDNGGNGGNEDFGDHAAGADEDALPLAFKRPCRAGVDVRAWHQHEEHDAHFVAFPAETPAGEGVAHFVQKLRNQESRAQRQPHLNAAAAQKALRLRIKPAAFRQDQKQRQPDNRQPDQRPKSAEQRADHRHPDLEKPIRIPQRNAWEQQVHQPALELAIPLLFLAAQEHLGIGGDVRFNQVRAVKLRKDLNDFRLRRRIVGQLSADEFPGIADAARAIEETDELVRDIGESVKLVPRRVADDVPALAPKVLPADLRSSAQARLEVLDAIPALGKCRAELEGHSVAEGVEELGVKELSQSPEPSPLAQLLNS